MLPQAPRREGGPPRRIHWTYTQIPKGSSVHGYIGAKTQWIWLHSSLQSKPCLHEMTGGEVACPYCASMRAAEVKGFFCYYRQSDGKPCACWLNEEQRDSVDVMPLHLRVELSRERTKGSPVAVRTMLDQNPRFTSSLPERQVWSDSTVSLVALLKCPLLVEWVRQTQGREHAPAKTPALPAEARTTNDPTALPEVATDGADSFLLGASWLGRLPADVQAEVRARRNAAFLKETESVKKNGKH